MHVELTPRETLRQIVDNLSEDKVWDALIAVEDILEPNEETKQAIDDAIHGRNLIGPFYDVKEMHEALLSDKTDEELMLECAMREKERKKLQNGLRS
ncbi:MAG: hypothetical protein IJP48_10325 [Synergistaceae bacterium]|nr:hypothetical protein [Synergistaceae bacterium]